MSAAVIYMESRAIVPEVAAELGIKRGRTTNELCFPNGRRRLLDEGRMMQEKNRPLEAWWIPPPEDPSWAWVLVCEGESDALAARSYLPHVPECTGLRNTPILCIPGTGYPVERLRGELVGRTQEALLALDPDEAGNRYAEKAERELVDVGIRPIRVEVPKPDLAGWLARNPVAHRPHLLADTLINFKDTAPTLEDYERDRQILFHRERIAQLEAA